MNVEQPVRELIPVMQRRMLSRTTYAGVPAVKCPVDAWIYQEIVWERRPRYIIEIGNWAGGSLLMYAHWLDAMCAGEITTQGYVIGVDVDHSRAPRVVRQHPRITLVTGDALAAATRVAAMVEPRAETLIIEDSSHEAAQTLEVLRAYEGLVQPGGYFIVEDTICWHGLEHGPQPGPYEAVEAFLTEQAGRWERDRGRESFGLSWNPGGYLRRKATNYTHVRIDREIVYCRYATTAPRGCGLVAVQPVFDEAGRQMGRWVCTFCVEARTNDGGRDIGDDRGDGGAAGQAGAVGRVSGAAAGDGSGGEASPGSIGNLSSPGASAVGGVQER